LTGVPLTTPHGLQIAAEALFDAGSHILAGEFQDSAGPRRAVRGDGEAT